MIVSLQRLADHCQQPATVLLDVSFKHVGDG
jgi:hypothetical protein